MNFSNTPLVSIILPLYNGENTILSTIQSVVKQTYKNWELIIVDDYSKDNSLNIIKNHFSENNSNYWKKRYFGKKYAVINYRTGTKKKCKVSYDSRFEDKASFNSRKSSFGPFCKEQWLNKN